jgi:hypothetical protein
MAELLTVALMVPADLGLFESIGRNKTRVNPVD